MPAEGPPSTDSEPEDEVDHGKKASSRRIPFREVDHEEEILEKKMIENKEGTLFLQYWSRRFDWDTLGFKMKSPVKFMLLQMECQENWYQIDQTILSQLRFMIPRSFDKGQKTSDILMFNRLPASIGRKLSVDWESA